MAKKKPVTRENKEERRKDRIEKTRREWGKNPNQVRFRSQKLPLSRLLGSE